MYMQVYECAILTKKNIYIIFFVEIHLGTKHRSVKIILSSFV